ncbi:MAG TPA: hypothetical protein P5544_03005 [Candidatus Nanopelagicales bacterium]|nr:hypothetical protein [Candidatus Nanopelagicales bacterium]
MDRYRSRTRRMVTDSTQQVESQTTSAAEAMTLRNRKAPRSKELVDAILSLDTQTDPAVQQQVVDWIRECYVERYGGDLVGLMAHCYLGGDFVDHRIDASLHIIEHFTESNPAPAPFHMARPLARSTAYAFIELYSDGSMVPVRHDGTQAV